MLDSGGALQRVQLRVATDHRSNIDQTAALLSYASIVSSRLLRKRAAAWSVDLAAAVGDGARLLAASDC
jgi:hypothetical protein